ncbi:MAG: magnesium/cobalt transporter CorA [Mycobacteriales bacterium]
MSVPGHTTRRQITKQIVRRRGAPAAAGSYSDSATPRRIVDCGVYVDGQRVAFDGDYADAARIARDLDGFVWLGMYEPTEREFSGVAEEFGLHPLAVEDAVHARQRPKLERYDDTLVVALKTVSYVEHEELTATSEVVETGEVMVFVGSHFAITVRHGQHGALRAVRSRLQDDPGLLRLGPSSVLYAVADQVVDDYLRVVTEIEDDVDEVETSVFTPRRHQDVERIYQLKREVMELRRAVAPLAGPLHTLAERRLAVVPEDIREYFLDVEDHLTKAREQITGFEEVLSSILQACIARLTMAENEDMRKISAWVAIAAVPTAIAAIYGMNFRNMPELHWRYGYPIVMGVIVAICLVLYRGFRRSGWL